MADAGYIKHTDASAPDIRPQGGIAAVLRHCLVTNGNWTEPFTAASNVAVFRSPVSEGGYYLRVDESNAGYSILTGYGSMSDLSTGSDRFPDSGTDVYFRNYYTNVATDPERWVCYYTDRCFWLLHRYGASSYFTNGMFFGKPNIDLPSDSGQWDCMLLGKGSNSSSNSNTYFGSLRTSNGGYWIRDLLGNSGHEPAYRNSICSVNVMGSNGYSYPIQSGMAYGQVSVGDDDHSDTPRGWMPGLINPAHDRPFSDEDTFTLSDPGFADGAEFEVWEVYYQGILCISDHTDLWE